MPAPTLILTIVPERDGTHSVLVLLHDANGAPLAPPRQIPVNLDYRLGAFVAAVEALARLKLTSIESPASRPDCNPAIAVEDADSKLGR